MDLNKLAELLRYDPYEEIDLSALTPEPSTSTHWTEGFVPRPRTSMQYLANARLVSAALGEGLTQKTVAAELRISAQDVSRYKKVARRWPEEASNLIEAHRDRITAGTIVKLANQSFSDVRGGDPRGKYKKASLLATIRALILGRKRSIGIRGDDSRIQDLRSRLIQETERNQRLAQELRDLKSSDSSGSVRRERKRLIIENERLKAVLATHGVVVKQQQRMGSVTIDPNINYLLSLFIAKAQVSSEIDEDAGLLVISAGNKTNLANVLERLT